MPHQCTECGHAFEDGSKEMLSGCPECGGNKFQFIPGDATSSSEPSPEAESAPDEPRPDSASATTTDREDRAQADARSSVIDADELPTSAADSTSDTEPEDEETPDLSQLREELNDQFESIRIVDHGQYELNLMELYKREEFIIALQENGRYVIEVPESFRRGSEN